MRILATITKPAVKVGDWVAGLPRRTAHALEGTQAVALGLLWLPAVIVFVFFLPDEHALPRDRVGWAGMLFQLVGLTTVVLGMWRLLRQFAPHPIARIRGTVAEPLRRFKHIFLPPPAVGASGTLEARSAQLGGAVETLARGDGSLDDRVELLEKREKELSGQLKKVRQDFDTLANRLNLESHARERDGRDIKKTIEDATIGGIGVEITGVFYIAIGIVLASAPELVVYVFGW